MELVLFFKKMKNSLIKPQIIDAHNSNINSKISIKSDHVFENFEYSPALKIGLSESVKRINDIGIIKIEKILNSRVIILEIN